MNYRGLGMIRKKQQGAIAQAPALRWWVQVLVLLQVSWVTLSLQYTKDSNMLLGEDYRGAPKPIWWSTQSSSTMGASPSGPTAVALQIFFSTVTICRAVLRFPRFPP